MNNYKKNETTKITIKRNHLVATATRVTIEHLTFCIL